MNQQLADVAARFWDRLMEANPTSASLVIGDHRFADRMDDFGAEAEAALAADLRGYAVEAAAIDPGHLDDEDRITRLVVVDQADWMAASLECRLPEFMVDPLLGPQMDIVSSIPQLSAPDAEVAAMFIAKAGDVGRHLDGAIDRLRAGVAAGRTPVRVLAEKTVGQLDAMVDAPVEDDPFLAIGLPESMNDAARADWRDGMARRVRDVVRPALARYRDHIRAEVLAVARPGEKAGVCWLPDGDEVYARQTRYYTSLEIDPDAVHRLGLDEIASIEDEYRELGGRVLGTDDVAEIYERLRTDPSLRFETAEQVQEAAETALARANEAAPGWFGRLPKAPCVVMPIPAVGAEDAPLAYYLPPAQDGSRPGVFFINLTEPETRTRYESEALAFHEAVPGHHLQLTIGQELEDLPMVRRYGLTTAYVEGWGLYTERLADEMGLYSGDLERLGILSFDSWRAGRLVVDTGLHAQGWSRRQAIDYLTANSPQAPNNIVNEVDRYIGFAGQALAYKLGQREIFRLREAARAKLGASFDIKAFHDTVLGSGALPLRVLADVVERWADQPAA